MRWAAKAGQDKLEWSILDVEQDEWERRLAELGVAAAANGFPVYPSAPREKDEGIPVSVLTWDVRRVLPALALLVVLGSLSSYSIWHRAQEGIARMQGDVANAVKIENVQENSLRRWPARHESVQTVEFLGSAAQATVLVTRTLGTGGIRVQPELRFYVQTPKGWQRSDPVAGFWGSTETLDTAHLHFVFGRRDRMVVAAVAPGAEAVYAMLRRATGRDLAGNGLLTMELVPEVSSPNAQPGGGRIRLTSPALYPVAAGEQAGILGRLLRLTFCRQLMATAQGAAIKPQWQLLVQGLGVWLAFTGAVPFAPDGEDTAPVQLRYGHQAAWGLDGLLGEILRYDPQSGLMQAFTLISDLEQQKQREAAAEQLIDYIAGAFGIDVLPKLLQGFAQYDDLGRTRPCRPRRECRTTRGELAHRHARSGPFAHIPLKWSKPAALR